MNSLRLQRKTDQANHIINIPNLLTCSRLILLPIFFFSLWNRHYSWSLLEIIYMSLTDYFDGKLARYLNQATKLGTFLDPLADRLFMITIPLTMFLVGLISAWILIPIMLRELGIVLLRPILRKKGILALPVIYLGKVATFTLMLGFTLILAGNWQTWISRVCHYTGLGITYAGIVLYLYTLLVYWWQACTIQSETSRILD